MELINIIKIILITFLPGLELRMSIPYGIINGLNPVHVFITAVISNILLGELIFYCLNKFLIYVLKINFLKEIYNKCVLKIQKRAHKYVEKYGEIGLALFISVPLPGSGVYSGALGAFIFGFKRKSFSKANIIGVMIAGIIVTFLTIMGYNLFI
ncbi:MAG: hypothetical protein B6U88_01765 [Candidatus Aenigmarchaeota archaeon ex4484_56]|nr:MAG: hypothetical protein B6U88_01765 [Candidatus Aenigmarchaeota archaeon ex4484_56]